MPPKGKKATSLTKAQLATEIATKTGMTKSQVNEFFIALSAVVAAELKSGHPVVIPGLVKVTIVHKAATQAREGINPFTKQKIMIKAKPARKAVKVRPIKALKGMV